jgi:DnaJ-domain-containing protein 1
MEGQFHVGRRSRVTTQESYDDLPALDPNPPGRPSQFVIDIQRLLGAESEPDPLFFVESWSLGVEVAVENFHRRCLGQADRERNGNASHTLTNIQALPFMQERELNAEFLSSARAAAISACHDAGSPPQFPEEPAAWTPHRWAAAADEHEGSGEIPPMTPLRAFQLLGVTAASTRRQIKAAYRQMVSQWHPDRLEGRSQGVRQFATEKMVEINAAYQLLRNRSPRQGNRDIT